MKAKEVSNVEVDAEFYALVFDDLIRQPDESTRNGRLAGL
jgi:hypothetical protein